MRYRFAWPGRRALVRTFFWGVFLSFCGVSGCQSSQPVVETDTGMLLDSVNAEVSNLALLAHHGDRKATVDYGVLLGQAGNWEKAGSILHFPAEQGEVSAQYTLADILIKQGKMQAGAHWMQLAAQQGMPAAQRRLARLYARGDGVVRDDKRAFYWDMKAAQQGDPEAQNNVGAAYSQGRGVAFSAEEAFSWYKRSARQGDIWGQFNLAGAYLAGAGTSVNAGVAYAWYTVVLKHAEGELKQMAEHLQHQSMNQVTRTGRVKQANALADTYMQRYATGE